MFAIEWGLKPVFNRLCPCHKFTRIKISSREDESNSLVIYKSSKYIDKRLNFVKITPKSYERKLNFSLCSSSEASNC